MGKMFLLKTYDSIKERNKNKSTENKSSEILLDIVILISTK